MKSWYTIKNQAAGVLDITIHEEIGMWGKNAHDFLSDLNSHPDVHIINLSINSPGGNLFDGFAMYNGLRAHQAYVYGEVVALAASAASVVLMGADRISMPENSLLMIHNPWTLAIGDADEFRKIADDLEKFQEMIVNIYENRSGLSRESLSTLMSDETFLTAEEALESGFIDNISDVADVAASFKNFSRYFDNLPSESLDVSLVESIDSVTELESFLREAAGLSKTAAKALVARAKQFGQRDAEPDDLNAEFQVLTERLDAVRIPESIT